MNIRTATYEYANAAGKRNRAAAYRNLVTIARSVIYDLDVTDVDTVVNASIRSIAAHRGNNPETLTAPWVPGLRHRLTQDLAR